MSSSFGLKLERDDVSKDLQRMLKGMSAGGARPLLKGIGVGIVGLAKDAFNNASLRPAPWAAKKDGTPATLKSKEATLWRSLRVQQVSGMNVTVGSDRPYAAIHQLGGESRPMPARPYFPILNNKLTIPAQKRIKDIMDEFVLHKKL